VAGGCRTVHNEEPHNLYASPNTNRIIKSRMRWAGHVADTEMRHGYKILIGNLMRRDHSEDLGVDGISEWMLRKEVGTVWTGFI